MRDWAITLACLCVVLMTALAFYSYARLGQALADLDTPVPDSTPVCVGELPC